MVRRQFRRKLNAPPLAHEACHQTRLLAPLEQTVQLNKRKANSCSELHQVFKNTWVCSGNSISTSTQGMNTVDEKCEHHCSYATCNRPLRKPIKADAKVQLHSPEKQSIREAMVHLLARYLEMRPLFLAAARPIKVEWKMRPYLGVLPRVFRALCGNDWFHTQVERKSMKDVSKRKWSHSDSVPTAAQF